MPANNEEFLNQVKWNDDGLICAIAQDSVSGKILMLAWMNREALKLTNESRTAVYWSRSRQALWKKGESSGFTQNVITIKLDCDGDAIVLEIEQKGGIACHTGRESCFYRRLDNNEWHVTDAVLKDPKDIYS
ncbi:MAG: phosphoribosyl-AMP cyclohydrolase [Flavobacteriales bacterium]|jgi:phosphoribosyl-AMP cyclohydrolase